MEESIYAFFSELVVHHDDSFSFFHFCYFPILGPSSSRARTGLDSPYVVQFHNCRVLAKAEELFTVNSRSAFVVVVVVVVLSVDK